MLDILLINYNLFCCKYIDYTCRMVDKSLGRMAFKKFCFLDNLPIFSILLSDTYIYGKSRFRIFWENG